MTEVGSAVCSAVGTVVIGVGMGVLVVVGTCVAGTVAGGSVGAGVVAEVAVFVATAVNSGAVVGTGVTPGSGVPGGDCIREMLSPVPATGPANGVPICVMCGNRRPAAAPRTRMPAMTNTQAEIPLREAGPAV